MKDIKMFEPICVNSKTSIVEAAKTIKDKKIRHLYIIDDNEKPVGIISAVDISNKVVAEGKDPNKITASEVMNSPVETVDINAPVELAMNVMMKRKTYSCLITENEKVKGVVDYRTVMEQIVKSMEEEDA